MHPPLIPNAIILLVPSHVLLNMFYVHLPTYVHLHIQLSHWFINICTSNTVLSNTIHLHIKYPPASWVSTSQIASIHVFPNLHKASGDSLTPPYLHVTSVNIISRQEAKTKDAIYTVTVIAWCICHQTEELIAHFRKTLLGTVTYIGYIHVKCGVYQQKCIGCRMQVANFALGCS